MNVDIARLCEGQAECILTPAKAYKEHFFELFLSISYDWSVSDQTVKDNMAKVLATIELLEREHYYCKITLVFPDRSCNYGTGKSNLFVLIPIFSHKDIKSIETMSAVLNEMLLRKSMFAVLENMYGDSLAGGYGSPVTLPKTINVGYDVSEVDLASQIINKIIVPCQSR